VTISGTDRSKLQKAVTRIDTGNFDETDLDSVLNGLRQYCGANSVFREVADFLAHRDLRDRGPVRNALRALYLSMTYFRDYSSPKIALAIDRPFPKYIKELMLLEIDKCEDAELRSKFGISGQRLRSKITKVFAVDKSTGTCVLKGNASAYLVSAMEYLLGAIRSHPPISEDDFFDQLETVLGHNGFTYSDQIISNNRDRLCLCLLLLMHRTDFKYGGPNVGKTEISCGVSSVPIGEIDRAVSPQDWARFECLQVNGSVGFKWKDKIVDVQFPILITSLPVVHWTDPSLFVKEDIAEQLAENYKHFYTIKFDAGVDVRIDENFRLNREAP
jgi:hypothetical protein